jgi:hypothetical protein
MFKSGMLYKRRRDGHIFVCHGDYLSCETNTGTEFVEANTIRYIDYIEMNIK